MFGNAPNRYQDLPSGEIEGPANVDIESLSRLPVVKVFKGSAPASSGVVYQDVKLSIWQFLLDCRNELINIFHCANITNNKRGAPAYSRDRVEILNRFLETIFPPSVDDDLRCASL